MSNPARTAIILAAGRATRMGAAAAHKPKCLLRVGGVTLLDHSVTKLRAAGFRRIVVVVGHFAEQIRRHLGDAAEYILNPDFATTNNLASFCCSEPAWEGPFVLLYADVLYHPAILAKLQAARGDIVLGVSPRACGEEEMRVEVAADRVVHVAKGLPDERTFGEYIGLARFSPAGARRLCRVARESVLPANPMAWIAQACTQLADAGERIDFVNLADLPYIEIDFPEEIERAEQEILPQIGRPAADGQK
jgi:choline kinase